MKCIWHWREYQQQVDITFDLIQFTTSSTNSFVSEIDDQYSDVNTEDSQSDDTYFANVRDKVG